MQVERKRLEIDESRLVLEERTCNIQEERDKQGYIIGDANRVPKYYVLPAEFFNFQ